MFRLHCACRVDTGQDGEADVLGERSPGRTNAFESGVNRRQIVQIGARVALLRRRPSRCGSIGLPG